MSIKGFLIVQVHFLRWQLRPSTKIQMPKKYAPKIEIAVLETLSHGTNTSVFYFNSPKIHPPSSCSCEAMDNTTICYNGTFWIAQRRLPTLVIERYKRIIVIIIIWSVVPFFSLSQLPSVELMPLHPLACLFVPTHNCSWWVSPDWFVLCTESERYISTHK